MESLLEVAAVLLDLCHGHNGTRRVAGRSPARIGNRSHSPIALGVWFLLGFPLGIVVVTAIPRLSLHPDLVGWLS